MGLAVGRRLVPVADGFDCTPRYLIIGGLVFIPLSCPWLEAMTNVRKEALSGLLPYLAQSLPEEGAEIVVLAKVLADRVNVGYHEGLECSVLLSLNEQPVANLRALAVVARELLAAKTTDPPAVASQ